MENRYKLPKKAQTQYFSAVEKISRLNQNQLAALFGIVSRSYRDWRQGKFAIPQSTVFIIEKKFHIPFPILKNIAFLKWKHAKQKASHLGGLALFSKHGSPATQKGRMEGGSRALALLRAQGIIPYEKPFYSPMGYSKQLAELVGVLLGDGHIGKAQWSITLNDKTDKTYASYVIKLIAKLFSFTPSVLHRKNIHVLVIYGGGQRSIAYFQKLGLRVGNKVKQQVGVPEWIKKNKSYTKECLRGLIETDGGIFKHKYVVNGKKYTYTKLCFSNRSIPLLQFVFNSLESLGLTPKLIDKVENKKVWLYNQTEVKHYIQQVGIHNPRMLSNLGG